MARLLRRVGLAGLLLLVGTLLTLSTARAQPLTPGQAATDELLLLVFTLALIIGLIVEGLLIAALILFRRKEGEYRLPARVKTKDTRLEFIWTALPVLVIAIVAGATFQTLTITDTIPEEPDFTIRVIASQFLFRFEYPDGSVVNDTLRVQVNSVVRLEVTSTDVIHSYFVVDFRLKLDAVPGRINEYWFQPLQVGTYGIQCAEYCGVGHFTMLAVLEVFPEGTQSLPYGPAPEE